MPVVEQGLEGDGVPGTALGTGILGRGVVRIRDQRREDGFPCALGKALVVGEPARGVGFDQREREIASSTLTRTGRVAATPVTSRRSRPWASLLSADCTPDRGSVLSSR